jgi:hypothetical protein
MTIPYYSNAIFLGYVLIASAGFARADIVQCAGQERTVNDADGRCQNGANSVRASTKPSAQRTKVPSPARTYAAAREARDAAWAKRPASKHKLPHDAATLEAARSSLLLMDNESSLLRQQKLAALDRKDQRWFKF